MLHAGVAQSCKLARLQNAKEMRLKIERKVADLIQKQCTVMGRADKTDAIAIGTAIKKGNPLVDPSMSHTPFCGCA
jgi:hypothetical protein